MNSVANLDRIHSTAKPTQAVKKRRKRRRSRPHNAQNKKSLEAGSDCLPNPPRKKQKHNPQVQVDQQKADQGPFSDKTNTVDDLYNKSRQNISSHIMHTQASCQYQSTPSPTIEVLSPESTLDYLQPPLPQSDILLDIQAAFPYQCSSKPKPIKTFSNQLAIADTVLLSPPLSSSAITDRESIREAKEPEWVLDLPEWMPANSVPVFKASASVPNTLESAFDLHESVLNKPKSRCKNPEPMLNTPKHIPIPPEPIANKPESVLNTPESVLTMHQSIQDNPDSVDDEPDSIVLLSSSEEEDNNDSTIPNARSDSDIEDASNTTPITKP